ncbi:hypothetical protein [Paraburkholderia hospita]|uniref:hypothetical protein n=1 Tax=Paraburkholderia hospita TaxID=169430 RepID=UPI0008A766E1|nr:hypothetical protein [Paraburkholderia hospita]SEI14563.1 hypothetical protein SAMN05192544_102563 [Paraburkholderia hospita]
MADNPTQFVDDYGMPTSRLALAQDHWLNVMSLGDRVKLMSAIPQGDMSVEARHQAILRHVADNLLDYSVTDGNILSARARNSANSDSKQRPAWTVFEALEQVRAALPDPGFAERCGLSYEAVALVSETVEKAKAGPVPEADMLTVLLQGKELLPAAWASHGGVSEELSDRLDAAIAAARVRTQQAAPQALRERPSMAFKEQVIKVAYAGKGIEPVMSEGFLAAKVTKTGRGIFVVPATLNRAVYQDIVAEAKDAGLQTDRVYVFAEKATYTGHGIEVMKFDDLPSLRSVDGTSASVSPRRLKLA